MKFLLVGLAALAVAQAATQRLVNNNEEIIRIVNEAKTTWTAGHNFAPDTSVHFLKKLMGVRDNVNGNVLPRKVYSGKVAIPQSFDARKQWPNCPTISHLLDQGSCGSCWAVAAASAFSDRACIHSNGTFTTPLSVEELLSCCDECGNGCGGGYPESAWEYFKENGIVTGGDYDSKVGCQPYTIQPCEHHTTGSRPACSSLPMSDTPTCQKKCQNAEFTAADTKHYKLQNAYGFDSPEAVQEDILKYGSAEAAFTVYADFVNYKSGVYQYVTGDYLGGHAVRVIGWGTENDVPYWLVANSWNNDWGDKGLFKIARGTDECGFEDGIVAGSL